MIKEALQYIVGLSGIHTIPHGEEQYSDRQLYRVPNEIDPPEPLVVNTLSGFMDYVISRECDNGKKKYIQIISPEEVRYVSSLDSDNNRSNYIKAKAVLPKMCFGSALDQERFLIWLRTSFVETDARDGLIQFCGCVTGNDTVNLNDDGVSQKVSVSTYIGTQDAIAPTDPVLRPYRTFVDVEQPESPFVFRAERLDKSIGFVIYEADGGAWRLQAMDNIRKYILTYMEEYKDVLAGTEIVVIC